MNHLEDRLRSELEFAVRDVTVPDGLPAAVSAGGRRRLRRRRALVTAPVTAVVAAALVVGGNALSGHRPAPAPPAASSAPEPTPPPTSSPTPSEEVPAGTVGDDAAVDEFLGQHTYDDAVALAELWNTDAYDAKVTAGRMMLSGETLPLW